MSTHAETRLYASAIAIVSGVYSIGAMAGDSMGTMEEGRPADRQDFQLRLDRRTRRRNGELLGHVHDRQGSRLPNPVVRCRSGLLEAGLLAPTKRPDETGPIRVQMRVETARSRSPRWTIRATSHRAFVSAASPGSIERYNTR